MQRISALGDKQMLCEQAIARLRGGSLRAKTAGRRLSWRNRIIARQKLKLSVRLSRLKTYGGGLFEYHVFRAQTGRAILRSHRSEASSRVSSKPVTAPNLRIAEPVDLLRFMFAVGRHRRRVLHPVDFLRRRCRIPRDSP